MASIDFFDDHALLQTKKSLDADLKKLPVDRFEPSPDIPFQLGPISSTDISCRLQPHQLVRALVVNVPVVITLAFMD